MSTVKTYQGHDVPEGSEKYQEEDGVIVWGFWKDVGNGAEFLGKYHPEWTRVGGKIPSYAIALPQEYFVPVVGEECMVVDREGTLTFATRTPVKCVVAGLYKEWIMLAREGWPPMTTKLDQCDYAPVKSEREKVMEWARKEWFGFSGTKESFDGHLYDIGALTIPK